MLYYLYQNFKLVDVNAQDDWKNERKKKFQTLVALSPNQSFRLGIYSIHTLAPVNQDEGTNPWWIVKVHPTFKDY